MNSLVDNIKSGKVLVADGAWGTFLHAKGLQAGDCPEEWNLTHRNEVFEVAKSYVDSGADLILTNSFGGSPQKLKHYGLAEKVFDLNKAAAEISKEAAGDKSLVAGSIGPTGVILMMGEVSSDELLDGFKIQAEALAKGGADAICVETMSATDEALLAIEAAKAVTDLEVICTFTFDKSVDGSFKTMMGVDPKSMVEAVLNAGANIIGSNCGNGFDNMIDIVKIIRSVDANVPVLVNANAGMPILENNVTKFHETPEIMASKISKLIEAGANVIGGCCGTTPQHIRAIALEIEKFNESKI